ncbi:unnamed protein product [Cochlearia groenlandica]
MSIGDKSPRSKVKFMCSFGGKILPRPSDGILKYVGGETRVIAVSPDISFSDLSKKLVEITENEIVLKYQIVGEDLDALVSVKSDEDLKHMMEEYNRHETPKLRTFLFPSNPPPATLENRTIEQRYIEAINGINVRTPKSVLIRGPIKTRPSFTISSACSSPRSESSPEGYTYEQSLSETGFHNNSSYQLSRLYPMHRVQSSPNINSSQQFQPHNNAYFQTPNYLTCRIRPPQPPPPLDFPRWDHPLGPSGVGGNGKCGCNEDRRLWGRANSVPHSPRNYGLRL